MREATPSLSRSLAIMVAAIALWWVAPGALRRLARESFYELQAPLLLAESRLRDLRLYWEASSRSKDELLAAARDLARSNADLAVRLAQTDALRAENRRLEEALALPSRPHIRQVVARVAQRDIGRWWSRVTLAKGRVHGVKEGCSVINGGGVVGRVVLVHAATCEVELVTDPSFRISATLEGDERERPVVVYKGATTIPFEIPRGQVSHIPSAFKNTAGHPLQIVSSGLGGVFLGGLYIGTLETDPVETSDGLFREASVRVRPDLLDLQEATILVPQWDPGRSLP